MSKDFDMVEWVALFEQLIKRNISFIILRLMLFIYGNQSCAVKWSGQVSECFSVSNGVRQGAVSSAILFAIYIDELLNILKESRLGCHIDSVFVGAFIFADDIILLSASRPGLQTLVDLCSKFASKRNLTFGINVNPLKSKTKCIVFSKKVRYKTNLAPIVLDGQRLPWVDRVNHLGCILEADNSMKMDILAKRGQFVGKSNALLQEFHFVTPSTLLRLISSYATTFYGSSLWNLQSKDCERMFNSWNVTIQKVLNVSFKTHRFLIEPLSKQCHLKTLLLSRYLKFYRSLIDSPKFTVRYLARIFENDQRTVLGTTLQYLSKQCHIKKDDLYKINPQLVKSRLMFDPVPPE